MKNRTFFKSVSLIVLAALLIAGFQFSVPGVSVVQAINPVSGGPNRNADRPLASGPTCPDTNAKCFVVNRTDDAGNGFCTTSSCTLRDALQSVKSADALDEIVFSVTGQISITASLGLPYSTVNAVVKIIGNGIAIDGGNNVQILTLPYDFDSVHGIVTAGENNITLKNLSLRNGKGYAGGAILNGATNTLTLQGVFVYHNEAIGGPGSPVGTAALGGAIYSAGTLIIDSSTFQNNKTSTASTQAGGAIASWSDTQTPAAPPSVLIRHYSG